MKKQIVQISLLQTAKVAAGLYFVISLPAVLLMMLVAPLLPMGSIGKSAIVLWPLGYSLLAFLMTLIGGALYNLVARVVGGVEFTTKEIAPDTALQ
jgi:hypothetical protein